MTTHELHARTLKARQLAEDLMARLDADTAESLTAVADTLRDGLAADIAWVRLAEQAGVRSPSVDTRREVIAHIEARARVLATQPSDPFAGFEL